MIDILHASYQLAQGGLDLTKIDLPRTQANEALIKKILSLVFIAIGSISVMMVVIGGLKYASSQGDSQGVAKARNTIIYAVVGLIVSIFSLTIVSFTVGRVA